MKIMNNHLLSLFISSLVLFSNTVFAISFFGDDDEDIIWQVAPNHFFKYTEQDSGKFGKNNHPVDLDEKEIGDALKPLKYLDKSFLSGETINMVFSASQIKLLSQQLAKGLKNANPEQDIIFVLPGSARQLLILTKKSFLAGRAFYKEGKLNIILGDYNLIRNEAFEKVIDPSGSGKINYSFNYGKRSRSSRALADVTIVNAAGIENKKLKKMRQDWFVIDVKLAAKSYLAKKHAKENPAAKQDKALKIEAAKLAKQRRAMRAEMARMRKEVQNISKRSSSAKSIEERMITLDELLAKKLITQEEHDKKRQEILSDI